MNLVIDIGNSRVKTGIFVKDKLVKNMAYDTFTLDDLKNIFKENPGIKASIICSVKKYPVSIKTYLKSHSNFDELIPGDTVSVKLGYKTPLTLGMDRLAAISGADFLHKKKNILVINAGTCITYDFLDSKNIFHGGSISPGLDMRYKALNAFTDGLPLIKADTNYKKLTGETTEESIKSGVQTGMVKEIEGIIREYQSKYKNMEVILTGGSAPWLLKSLKIKIKAEPYLVLTGLNVLLSLFQNQSTQRK